MVRWLVLLVVTGCGSPERPEGSFHTSVLHDGQPIACDMSSVTIRDQVGIQNRIDITNSTCATPFTATFFHMFDNVVDVPCDDLRVPGGGCSLGGFEISGTASRDDDRVVTGSCTCEYDVVRPGMPTLSHVIELEFRGPGEP